MVPASGHPWQPGDEEVGLTFRWISLRHALKHGIRTALTVFGVALGVAATTGTALLNASVSSSYERTVDRLAGKVFFQVDNDEAGVPEELLEEIRNVPGVGAAEGSVQGFVSVSGESGERLYILGLDLLAESKLRDYELNDSEGRIEDPLVFLAQPDSIAVTSDFLSRAGIAPGEHLPVRGPAGPVSLTVRATLDLDRGPAALFGGRLAVMDVFAAQRVFKLDRRFTQIDVGLAASADSGVTERVLRAAVAGRGTLSRSRSRGERFERVLAGNRFGMTATAAIAMIVGVYLVFNTMLIVVTQRRREFGILRAIGAERRQVFRLVALEALGLGVVGSVLGLPLAFILAKAAAAPYTLSVSQMYAPIDSAGVPLLIGPLLSGFLVGPACAVLAALLPAREAVRADPREAMELAPPRSGAPGSRRLALAGVLVLSATVALWASRASLGFGSNTIGGTTILSMLVGASLFAPLIVTTLAPRLELLLGRVLGATGVLASRNLTASSGRFAVTCAAFVVSLGGAIAVATMFSSIDKTVVGWIESAFGGVDLIVTSNGQPLSTDSAPFPADVMDGVAKLPGVGQVSSMRYVRVPYGDLMIRLAATDARLFATGTQRFIAVEGEPEPAIAALASGRGAVVNEAFARATGRWRGSTVRLDSPSGPVELPVEAVVIDASDLGVVYLGRELFRQRWRDDTVTMGMVLLEEPAAREHVATDIRARWGAAHALFVITAREFREEQETMLANVFASLYPLTALALAIALLGVTTALLAALQDRMRWISVLRAVGATRGQITRMLVVESALIGAIAGICATAAGSLVGYWGRLVFSELFHMSVLYRFPLRQVVFALIAAVGLASMAGVLPGRQAARLDPRRALSRD